MKRETVTHDHVKELKRLSRSNNYISLSGLYLAVGLLLLAESAQGQASHEIDVGLQTSLHSATSDYQKLTRPKVRSRGEWFLCLIIEGPRLLYRAEVYGVQPRYRSWNLEWRRHRPQEYPTDEGIGLISSADLGQLAQVIMTLTQLHGLTPEVTDTPPPCHSSQVSARPLIGDQSHSPEIIASLWLERMDSQSKLLPQWHFWKLNNPHLGSEGMNEVLDQIKAKVRTSDDSWNDFDHMLLPSERGHLYLKVSHPANILIDGVLIGQWPMEYHIPLPEGDYHIEARPIAPDLTPQQFDGIEVLRGKRTRFTITLE